MADHLRARLLAAAGETRAALESLDGLAQAELENGALRRQMSVQLSQALVIAQAGDWARAHSLFKEILNLAAAEGYHSLFFPYPGRPTRSLLVAARSDFPAFVARILNEPPLATQPPSAPFEALPEPLSEQEIRVLKLIMAGKSNAEIAAELVISVGTAKWHVHNVLQKMGVNTRTQAIVRAKTLDI
jgi:LuxR family maltose regulon positive regulatory protein